MSLLIPMKHSDLCDIAVRWLKRPNSQNGHGCHVAVSECRSGWTGEVPDAIGFRAAGGRDDGSIVVECKTSRSDFLADKKKAHRTTGGCGNWRYFMVPEGMISIEELPAGWGLLEVNSRGHVKPIAGVAAYFGGHYGRLGDKLVEFRHDADRNREQFLLTKLLHRVGDPEELNKKIKIAYAERNLAFKSIENMRAELRLVRHESSKEQRRLRAQLDEANASKAHPVENS